MALTSMNVYTTSHPLRQTLLYVSHIGNWSEFWKQGYRWLVERSIWDDPQRDVVRSKQRSEWFGSDFNEIEDQDQDSLLVKRRNENHSPVNGWMIFEMFEYLIL